MVGEHKNKKLSSVVFHVFSCLAGDPHMLCSPDLIPNRPQKVPKRGVIRLGKQPDKYIHMHSRQT